ncbi:MAG: lamin tail domain-containing protein [Verrucomicrobiota bacterium]|nr:lamin tail domain-containing protein [Verrucomicrobiota bacterium]
MKYLNTLCVYSLLLGCTSPVVAQVVINEIMATSTDRELQWTADGTPYVGHGPAWWMEAYDDAFWLSGSGPFGFNAGTVGTNVKSKVDGITPSLYLRTTFTVSATDATSANPVKLSVRCNDGFIAYLNGKEVARKNMGAKGLMVYSDQIAFNPGDLNVTIDLGAASGLLRSGTNSLAVQVHNNAVDDGKLLIATALKTGAGAATTLVAENKSWKYWVGLCEPSGGLFDPVDPAPAFANWIELYNTSDAAVNLVGWSLTDDAALPAKWTFPPVTIPAHGYLVVLADDKNITDTQGGKGRLHLSFNLDSNGEYLGLYDFSGNKIDSLEPAFPKQRTSASYGRSGGAWKFLTPPSPGGVNPEMGAAGYTKVPDFSVLPGFYASAQTVGLTVETIGATIRYTTDGTEPTLTNGTVYTTPLSLAKTTSVRVRAFAEGMLPSKTKTGTYLINENAAYKSMPAVAITGDPQQALFKPYGITAIVGGPNATADVENGAGVKEWVALTTEDYNIPINSGRAYERPVSVEIIYNDGTPPIQIDSGARVAASIAQRPMQVYNYTKTDWSQSRWSLRQPPNKPSINLFFRGEYDGDLQAPLFEGNVTNFDSLRLRAGKNDITNPFIADEFTRRLGRDVTGYPQARGLVANLWVNGVYRGYYNLCERYTTDFFQASYDSVADWDVIKGMAPGQQPAGDPVYMAEEGDRTAFNSLFAFFSNTDLSTTENYNLAAQQLDVTGFIDYLIPQVYAVTLDWHMNNWFAARERTANARWRFYYWDTEWGYNLMMWAPPVVDVMKSWLLINSEDSASTVADKKIIPLTVICDALHNNSEFRLLFADRIQKHFFNGGALAEERYQARFKELKDMLNPTMLLLDKREVDYSRNNGNAQYYAWTGRPIQDWRAQRFDRMMVQFAESGLWPDTTAPTLSQHGGEIPKGGSITLTHANPAGDIYYTLDGTDPREVGGAARGTLYLGPITINSYTIVKTRVLSEGEWSPVVEAEFTLPLPKLIITEIMYHPADSGAVDAELYEFIEFKNPGTEAVDLTGARFEDGVVYTVPAGTIVAPGGFLVIAANLTSFAERHSGVSAIGPYTGQLNNSGEHVSLVDAAGGVICEVTYSDDDPWPVKADGEGFSLVPVNLNDYGDNTLSTYWRLSTNAGGSPGAEDPVPEVDTVLRSFPDLVDSGTGLWHSAWYGDIWPDSYPWIWHLEHGWQFTVYAGGGSLWLFDVGLNTWIWTSPVVYPFVFDGSRSIWVFYYPGSTNPRYFYNFDIKEWEVVYGPPTPAAQNAIGTGSATITQKLNTHEKNALAAVAAIAPTSANLLLTEIMYHPPDVGTVDGDLYEFLEYKNAGTAPLDMSGTHFVEGVEYTVPSGTILAPGAFLVIAADSARFTQKYPGVAALGPFVGHLSNNGEDIRFANAQGTVISSVRYSDVAPWPLLTDNGGYTLVPVNSNDFSTANSPYYWKSSASIGGSPGREDAIPALAAFPDLVDNGTGLWHSAWYGDLLPDAYPWIWHLQHGWQYVAPAGGQSLWLYDAAWGKWTWTSSSVYPFVFESSEACWFYYIPGSNQPRFFYNFKTLAWVTAP